MEDLTGKILTSISGNKYFLSSVVGQGAQGIVYATSDDKNVIKFYKAESKEKNKEKLKKLKWLFNLNYPTQFIKPLDIFEVPYVGYAMKKVKNHISLNKLLVPNRSMSFSDWYNKETGGLYRRLLVGQKIAAQFANLHKKNMAYCDLSGSNILVNEDKNINSVCMIDIDNIYVPGTGEANVLGTSRYMAPEILNRQINPDIFTDSYSLAVILFELLRSGHPYIGDLVEDGTPEQENQAYRGLYPYVDDTLTDINRSSQMLPADVVFTTEMKNLFQTTFVTGKENRLSRTRAREFAVALQKASNLVVKCETCGNWHYAKPDENHKYICPWCDAEYEKPLRIAFYEKYNCKINNKKIEIKEKHLEDFILKKNSKNIITKNYVKDVYYEANDEPFEEYFTVRLGKDGKFYILNQFENSLAISKNNGATYSLISKEQIIPLEANDILIFSNPKDMKEQNIAKDINGIAFRYAVIKR